MQTITVFATYFMHCLSHDIVYKEEANDGMVLTIAKKELSFKKTVFTQTITLLNTVSHCQPFSTRQSSFVAWTISKQAKTFIAIFTQTITFFTQSITVLTQSMNPRKSNLGRRRSPIRRMLM